MLRRFSVLVLFAGLLAPVSLLATAPAHAAKKCVTYPSVVKCWKTTTEPRRSAVLVEQVAFTNRLNRRVKASCSFTKTIERRVGASVSITATARGKIFGIVDAETSVGVTAFVEQSSSQATTMAANFWVGPKERVLCKRVYRYMRTKVVETTANASSYDSRVYYTSVPRYIDVVIAPG